MSKDTNLINKLTTPDELSGLLNLALIALRQLKKDGGFRDISVEKVRKEYEYNANTVKAFLDDKCAIDLTSPEYCIPTVYLYNVYENFCQAKGVRPLEMNVFGSKLKEYGIEKERKRNYGDREYHYFGVKLRRLVVADFIVFVTLQCIVLDLTQESYKMKMQKNYSCDQKVLGM